MPAPQHARRRRSPGQESKPDPAHSPRAVEPDLLLGSWASINLEGLPGVRRARGRSPQGKRPPQDKSSAIVATPRQSDPLLCSWSDILLDEGAVADKYLTEQYSICSFRFDAGVHEAAVFGNLEASITGRHFGRGDSFFRVRVQAGSHDYTVCRAYGQFQRLHRTVCPADSPGSLPAPPKKSPFRRIMQCLVQADAEENVLEQKLGEFLQAAIATDPSLSNPALREFLGVRKRDGCREGSVLPPTTATVSSFPAPIAEHVQLLERPLESGESSTEESPTAQHSPKQCEPLQSLGTGSDSQSLPADENATPRPQEASVEDCQSFESCASEVSTKADVNQKQHDTPVVPEPGDIVRLGSGGSPEFQSCPAVVTKVFESHCSVVVLDAEMKFGIGESWPFFNDITIICDSWRMGTLVTISGLQNKRHQKLNGLTGTIAAHPKEGHPCFVQKPSVPDKPRFTLCVVMDDPTAAGQKSVLLEPQFLKTCNCPELLAATLELLIQKGGS